MQVVGRVGGRHASLDVCVCTVQGRDGASVVFELVCEMEYRPPAGRELMYQADKKGTPQERLGESAGEDGAEAW